MWRLLRTFALAVAVAGLFGCGSATVTTSSEPKAPVVPQAPTKTTSSPAPTSMTKSQASAFADAVILHPVDVPGFRVSSEKESTNAAEKRTEHELLRCVGAPNHKGDTLAQAKSREFEHETSDTGQSVSSEVEVMSSSAIAAHDLVLARQSQTPRCLAHYLGLLLKTLDKKGLTFRQPTITSIPAPLPATPSSFGYRIATAAALHGRAIALTMDIFGFTYGQADVTMFASGLPEPFSSATEQRLFSLLVQRARQRSS